MSNYNVKSIRLSKNALLAYNYLQSKKMKPAKILKDGGERLLIDKAIKVGLKLRIKKFDIPF